MRNLNLELLVSYVSSLFADELEEILEIRVHLKEGGKQSFISVFSMVMLEFLAFVTKIPL